jgi:hypothetical protein
MSIFEKDDGRVGQVVAELLERYHGELAEAGVRFDLLLAEASTDDNGDPVGPALKSSGYTAAATVRILGLKDRAKGLGDAEIVVDGDRWPEWSAAERLAILDHELEHLTLAVDAEGAIKRDDLGRPRLKLRLHDRQFGWFDNVARRHGAASVEVGQASTIARLGELRQMYLPGLSIEGDGVEAAVEIVIEPGLGGGAGGRPAVTSAATAAAAIMRRMGQSVERGGVVIAAAGSIVKKRKGAPGV